MFKNWKIVPIIWVRKGQRKFVDFEGKNLWSFYIRVQKGGKLYFKNINTSKVVYAKIYTNFILLGDLFLCDPAREGETVPIAPRIIVKGWMKMGEDGVKEKQEQDA